MLTKTSTKKIFNSFLRNVLLVTVFFILGTEICFADINNVSDWQFLVAPYGWATGINGTTSINDFSQQINISPIKFVKTFLKDGDFAGEVHLEAKKNRWTFMFDPSYLKLSATKETNLRPGEASAGLKFVLADFGIFYQLNSPRCYNSGYENDLQLLVGGRYFNIDSNLNFSPPLISLNTQQKSTAPIVGARWLVSLTPKINIRLRGDIGGFGVDQMHKTWSASLIASYKINNHTSIAAGFRALNIDYQSKNFKMDTTYYGPVVGLAFMF